MVSSRDISCIIMVSTIDTEERNFTTQSVYVNLTNLEEGTLYEISVCALNRAGEGPCVESM